MLRREQDGIHWLEFEILADVKRLRHGIFLRHGGKSRGDLGSLNLGLSVGDDPERVADNRKKVASLLGIQHFAWGRQCHQSEIHEVTQDNSEEHPFCDALATQVVGIGLMIGHADCQAAILYDPVRHAVANVHSGWRGSVQNIYAKTVATMQKTYGTDPADLLVGISPSLGPQHAEFVNFREELPPPFWEFQVKPSHFDFWAISRWQLQECGVLPHHIEVAEMCTFEGQRDFFSYRRNKPSGRHGTIVLLQ